MFAPQAGWEAVPAVNLLGCLLTCRLVPLPAAFPPALLPAALLSCHPACPLPAAVPRCASPPPPPPLNPSPTCVCVRAQKTLGNLLGYVLKGDDSGEHPPRPASRRSWCRVHGPVCTLGLCPRSAPLRGWFVCAGGAATEPSPCRSPHPPPATCPSLAPPSVPQCICGATWAAPCSPCSPPSPTASRQGQGAAFPGSCSDRPRTGGQAGGVAERWQLRRNTLPAYWYCRPCAGTAPDARGPHAPAPPEPTGKGLPYRICMRTPCNSLLLPPPVAAAAAAQEKADNSHLTDRTARTLNTGLLLTSLGGCGGAGRVH